MKTPTMSDIPLVLGHHTHLAAERRAKRLARIAMLERHEAVILGVLDGMIAACILAMITLTLTVTGWLVW